MYDTMKPYQEAVKLQFTQPLYDLKTWPPMALNHQGGRTCFGDIWIFAKYIEFYQSLFSRSERLTYYVLKYDNFKSVKVQGWTPLEILIFLHWTCRPTFTTLLGKRRAISHLLAVPKNRGKCKSATISLHRGDLLSASGPPPPWI